MQGLEKAQSTADLAQEETKRQAVMYERSIKKLYQEIELAKVDEEQRQRGIVKVGLPLSAINDHCSLSDRVDSHMATSESVLRYLTITIMSQCIVFRHLTVPVLNIKYAKNRLTEEKNEMFDTNYFIVGKVS